MHALKLSRVKVSTLVGCGSVEWEAQAKTTYERSKLRGQSQTNAAKAQDYGNNVLGPAWCFAGGLYATRNNNQLKCLLHNSTKAPKSIAKQTARHAVKRCFAPSR
ncbi:hypothetical protein TNCV_4765171 [Trichonephila clavipes]|nr:hypothetical protein TNCV_4765171 [Trichonephila clavipes]